MAIILPPIPHPTRIRVSKWAAESMSGGNLTPEYIPYLVAEFNPSYNAPGRHHHNVSHVNFMMKTIEQWKKKFDDPGVALWAAVGHDTFMDFMSTEHGRNERISAQDTADRLDGLVPYSRLQRVTEFIIATAAHQLPGGSKPTDDLALFLDTDMGCLGAAPAVYTAYAKGVRQEYLEAGIPAHAFRIGRIAFLEALQEQSGPIFLSTAGQQRFESQARVNISAELAELTDLTNAT